MAQLTRGNFLKWERECIWPAVMAATLLLIIGLTAWAAGQPWLFPSLGPTAYLLAKYPELPSSRVYNCIVGHLVGIASGFTAVAVFNAWQAPIVPINDVTITRIWAAVLAVGLTVIINTLLRSGHPPAAATTLLIALGTFNNIRGAVLVIIGVVLLVGFGEGLKRLRLVIINYRKKPAD